MSGWDWIHAGLEVASYSHAQDAQRHLAEMKTAAEMEMARRALLEAMRNFIFDISRDIQLAEEQLTTFPQQVYIVSKSLYLRLINSGLSAEVFPDFNDKEYVYKTQKKIIEVVEKSKISLTQQQLQQSEIAVQYVAELPLLQQAISAKSAQESIEATDKKWQSLSNQGSKKILTWLGFIGLILTMCVACPMAYVGLSATWGGANMLSDPSDAAAAAGASVFGLVLMVISCIFPIGTVALFVAGGKSNPEYTSLKTRRENWFKKLLPTEDWEQVVSTIGDLSSKQYRKIYEERIAFLNPILGGGFQKFLTTKE